MEFKPNEITREAARSIVLKFKEHNKGVVVGSKYLSSRDWDIVSAKWSDLMDSERYSLKSIREAMMRTYSIIHNLPEDTILGDTSIAFRHKTERGKVISYTYTDMYIFLREALRERKESADYLGKKATLEEAKRFIEENKSKDVKLKEAEELVAKLASELGPEEENTSTTTATATGNSVA